MATPTPLVVGVVGAGTMGAGIAQVCLVAGHEVRLYDTEVGAVERGRSRVVDSLGRMVEKGRMSTSERDAALGRLRHADDLDALAGDADIVIEAIVEDPVVKRTVFRHLDMYSRPDVLLATNTSALSVADIASAAHHRERVIGLHFFNPAPRMPLVEVVVTDETDREIAEAGVAFAAGLGKTTVVCLDSPGFIVNRVNRAFTLEALRMVEDGSASVDDVDAALEAAGYPMGPFRLMDLVGIDVNLAVATALYEGFHEPGRFQPSPIQRAMLESGRLGRKTGLGFYRYSDGASARSEPLPGGDPGAAAEPLTEAAMVERIELAIINEAYRAVEERVASPPDVDLALKLGANHPLGPFERAGALGLRPLVEGLRRLRLDPRTAGSGDQYETAPLLWQMAIV